MKQPALVLLLCLFASCRQKGLTNQQLQAEIDSLQSKLSVTYRPGLGEFMSGIQVHHEKLWFAGDAQNWALADFEIGEIKETIDDINTYCTDRPEVKSLPMIAPAIDSLTEAIKQKDAAKFKSGFVLLTNTCNNCHHATNHAFNVIKIPETPRLATRCLRCNEGFQAKAQRRNFLLLGAFKAAKMTT